MPAMPRVHEVASEAGVDVRVAMRALRDMGEHVKGPSSSIQVPVARKLRAALEQAGVPRVERINLGRQRGTAAVLARRLPAQLPQLVSIVAAAAAGESPGRALFRAAAEGERLYWTPGAAADLIGRVAGSAALLPVEEIPTPTGVAVISGGGEGLAEPTRLLWWRTDGAVLEAATSSFEPYSVQREPGQQRLRLSPIDRCRVTASPDGFPVSGHLPARLLTALTRAIPVASHNDRAPETTRRRSDPVAAPRGDTQLVYLQRGLAGGAAESAQEAVRRLTQWPVRGHWRNQWYPSEKDHHRIWIDEHLAGSQDAPVVTRRKVFVIRPRAGV